MESRNRRDRHRRSLELEEDLRRLQKLIEPVEIRKIKNYGKPKLPVIFIMGCARSGSTLLLQYLANTGIFAYPSNLISRFYFAPVIGSMIQKVLVDLDSKGELLGDIAKDDVSTKSILGKTKGILSPNEFWYFWRRFFDFDEFQKINHQNLSSEKVQNFLKELAGFQQVYNKPVIMKGMIMNWEIPFLSGLSPNFYFLHITRDVIANAVSLLGARNEFFGDVKQWYSFKPTSYKELEKLHPKEQVIRQVIQTNIDIDKSLSILGSSRSLKIKYEDFCENPFQILRMIREKFSLKMDLERIQKKVKFNISRADYDLENYNSFKSLYNKIISEN